MSSRAEILKVVADDVRGAIKDPDRNEKIERVTLTVEETAQVLGISRGQAYRGVKEGWIPSCRIGSRILVPINSVARLLVEADEEDAA